MEEMSPTAPWNEQFMEDMNRLRIALERLVELLEERM